jgi:hypothetical protein
MYYGARYYDRSVGLFVSPDTLVPDPTHVWDYNRYGYANLNPLKYNDPTGHCATNADGSENWQGEANTQCWQTAYAIYGYGLAGLPAFGEDWQGGVEHWLEDIAHQPFATTEYLQPFLDEYNSLFCAQAGLQCGGYQPDPARPHPIEYIHVNPAKLGIAGMKAGTVFGPMLMEAGVAVCAAGATCIAGAVVGGIGLIYTGVGYTAVIFDEVVAPLSQGNFEESVRNVVQENLEFALEQQGPKPLRRFVPWYGIITDLAESLCVGPSCGPQ